MKLKIEPPDARRESFPSEQRREVPTVGRVLDLLVERQELRRWCWAAICVSLGRFYGTGKWTQAQAASALLGFDCTAHAADSKLRARCDVSARLDDALALVGCHSHCSPGRPTFDRVAAEIVLGRPVCVQIEWRHGGSHYVVLAGYHGQGRELYVHDPLHGPSTHPFDGFPRSYQGTGGAWRATFWTCGPLEASALVDGTPHPETSP